MLHFSFARSQLDRRSTRNRHAIQVTPAAAFPRKNDVIIRPEKLPVGDDTVKHATHTVCRTKYLPGFPVLRLRDANGPGLAFSVGPRSEKRTARGNPQVRNLAPVGRPDRACILIYARV